jgi:polysaccharide export outer membrane protein
MLRLKHAIVAPVLLATAVCSLGQTLPTAQSEDAETRLEGSQYGSAYVLGPDDQIVIRAFKAEELSDKPIMIGPDNLISVQLIGTIRAGGLTVRQLENDITVRLAEYVREPMVSISVTEYRSQPVSVLGDVNNPGVHELRGQTSLLRMLSLAGGLKPDAGYHIKIVRRAEWGAIPLPGAVSDSSGKFSVAELNIKDLLEARRPEDNISVRPYDTITVPKADLIYVVGEVNKSGAFVLNEKNSMSVLQAVSRAEGLKPGAASHKARLLRPVPGSERKTELPLDIANMMKGSAPDVPLYPNDVLFVPNNAAKSWGMRTLDAMINVGTGIAIYRP